MFKSGLKFLIQRSSSQKFIKKSLIHQQSYHHPRRAVLYVPGDDERKLNKILKINDQNSQSIDCIALDCEDGVALNRKNEARETIYKFLQNEQLSSIKTDFGVRVNSLSSGLLKDDLNVICKGKILPKTIFLPKVESIEDLDYFNKILKELLKNQNDKINLIFYAESCKTIMNLPKICEYAINLSKIDKKFKLVGLVFGSDDFCASLGAIRTEKSIEILYARQRVVLIAKAFDLQAIDMVFIDFKNDEGLKEQSLEGAAMGYTGKQVIHPRQVDIVQNAFLPTKDKIEWAKGLLKAFEEHQKLGKGAFVYKNQMIDAPTMKQAQNIIYLINSIEMK